MNFNFVLNLINAEQIVLGNLLINNNLINIVCKSVNNKTFFKIIHNIIYNHIFNIINKFKVANIITVLDSMKSNNDYYKIPLNYLYFLVNNVNNNKKINILDCIEIIKKFKILKKLLNISKNINYLIKNFNNLNLKDIINKTEKDIYKLSRYDSISVKNNPKLLKHSMNILTKNIKNNNIKNKNIISSGFKNLDKLILGFNPGDLIIIAGRPSMGKTAFVINIINNIIFSKEITVLFFSLEMNSYQIATRLLSINLEIDQYKLKTNNLNFLNLNNINDFLYNFNKTNFYVDESTFLNINDLNHKSRTLLLKKKISLIIIDYIQLMSCSKYKDNKVLEISEISKSIKNLAKEINCPIIALSQLNRSLEFRSNKRPIMSDLRDSGALEQDADLILFLYREEVYNSSINKKGITELIIGKNRNGPTGIIKLLFIDKYTKFKNL